jgi:hypothetical protein
LLVSSFLTVYASSAIDKKKEDPLPDFLLRLSEFLSDGNATKLAQIRKKMMEQLELYQDKNAFTPTNVPPLCSRSTYVLDSVAWTWEYHGGEVDNAGNMVGYIDYSYGHIHTDEPDAEAWVVGEMTSAASGNVYLYGKAGPHTLSGWYNTAWVCISNDTEAEKESGNL